MRTKFLLPLLLLAASGGCAADGGVSPGPASASVPLDAGAGSPAMGAALARSRCSGCHAVERDGDSPMKAAPPLRSIGAMYPVSDLQEAFAEGLVTAHPAMPAFELEAQEIADLLAYLESIQGRNPGRTP